MSDILAREILRKSIHLSGILIPVIYYFIEPETAVFLLSAVIVALTVLELMRLQGYIRYPQILLRPHENKGVAGYYYSAVAALIVIVFLPKTIAIAAIIIALVGDTSSGIAGAIWGKNANVRHLRLSHKPLPILIVMFLSSFISGFLAVNMPGLENVPVFAIALAALGATIADGVPWQIRGLVLDDNLTIPLISALLLFLSKGL